MAVPAAQAGRVSGALDVSVRAHATVRSLAAALREG